MELEITSEQISRLCEHMRQGLGLKYSCALEGLSYDMVYRRTSGTDERHNELRSAIMRARGDAQMYWLRVLREDHSGKQARINAAEFMLGALDPDTYRERRDVAPSVTIQIVQGVPGASVRVVTGELEQVIDGDAPVEIPEHIENG